MWEGLENINGCSARHFPAINLVYAYDYLPNYYYYPCFIASNLRLRETKQLASSYKAASKLGCVCWIYSNYSSSYALHPSPSCSVLLDTDPCASQNRLPSGFQLDWILPMCIPGRRRAGRRVRSGHVFPQLPSMQVTWAVFLDQQSSLL